MHLKNYSIFLTHRLKYLMGKYCKRKKSVKYKNIFISIKYLQLFVRHIPNTELSGVYRILIFSLRLHCEKSFFTFFLKKTINENLKNIFLYFCVTDFFDFKNILIVLDTNLSRMKCSLKRIFYSFIFK